MLIPIETGGVIFFFQFDEGGGGLDVCLYVICLRSADMNGNWKHVTADLSRCKAAQRDDNERNVPEDMLLILIALLWILGRATWHPFVSHVCYLLYIKCFFISHPGRSAPSVAWICHRLLSTLSLH